MTLKSWIRWWAPAGLVATARKSKQNSDDTKLVQVEEEYRLPGRSLIELFPGIEKHNVDVSIGSFLKQDDYLLPIQEYLALMSICRHLKPLRIFEFGTY